jgi:hypothetical protein
MDGSESQSLSGAKSISIPLCYGESGLPVSNRCRFVAQTSKATQTANLSGGNMAQTHYTSKTKRRPKNSSRKDPSAATMAALRQLEAAAKK